MGVDKAIGDLAGPCGFAFCMGLGRLWYGKKGQNMDLSAYMMGAGALCFASYLTASLSPSPIVAFVGCMVSGLSVGIMWPGSISLTSASMPEGGTAMFALLALGGDMGAPWGHHSLASAPEPPRTTSRTDCSRHPYSPCCWWCA